MFKNDKICQSHFWSHIIHKNGTNYCFEQQFHFLCIHNIYQVLINTLTNILMLISIMSPSPSWLYCSDVKILASCIKCLVPALNGPWWQYRFWQWNFSDGTLFTGCNTAIEMSYVTPCCPYDLNCPQLQAENNYSTKKLPIEKKYVGFTGSRR